MDNFIEVALGGETHTLTVPELPENAILPGAFRGDMLAIHDMFLENTSLWTMDQCNETRTLAKEDFSLWAKGHYSWNQFLREVNILDDVNALAMANILFGRDLLSEMSNSLIGKVDEKQLMKKLGMPSFQQYFVTLLRAAARQKWWNRLLNNGVPDPKEDPMPPIFHSGIQKVQEIYKSKIQKFTNEVLLARGFTRETEAISAIILYLFGYLAEKPNWLSVTTLSPKDDSFSGHARRNRPR